MDDGFKGCTSSTWDIHSTTSWYAYASKYSGILRICGRSNRALPPHATQYPETYLWYCQDASQIMAAPWRQCYRSLGIKLWIALYPLEILLPCTVLTSFIRSHSQFMHSIYRTLFQATAFFKALHLDTNYSSLLLPFLQYRKFITIVVQEDHSLAQRAACGESTIVVFRYRDDVFIIYGCHLIIDPNISLIQCN